MHPLPARISPLALAFLSACACRDAVPDDTDVAVTDTGDDTPAPVAAPWKRDEVASPGSITFNEIQYHPSSGDEWLELHNPMAIDMDLSGWTLTGGAAYAFPDGTVLGAGGFLVVPVDLDGARVTLVSNSGRRIDSVAFGTDDPWPVAPDGTGATLAKIAVDTASDHAENWTASAEIGGTPGRDNGLDPRAPASTVVLVPMDTTWRYDTAGRYPSADWAAPAWDDAAWPSGPAIFYAGGASADVPATIRVTADNYYAVYLGASDGTDLRLVAADPDGDWTTVEQFDADVGPRDHLYVAAWEAPWDNGGPQMMIAEASLTDDLVGTGASGWEWVAGPAGACPGTSPTDPPPDEADVADLVAGASWAAPTVDADLSSSPWGWALGGALDASTRYVWADTFADQSAINTDNTYALFRTAAPLGGAGGTTGLGDVPTTTLFRTEFTFDGDPSRAELLVQCEIDDGAVIYLGGVEVLRANLPGGAIDAGTFASAPTDGAPITAVIPGDQLVAGENVLAVEVHQAAAGDTTLRFGCSLTARISADPGTPDVTIHEVPAGDRRPFWVELAAGRDADLSGYVLASAAGEVVLETALAAGALATVDPGFDVAPGDVLALYAPDRARLLDAARVGDRPRARDAAGAWRYPAKPTPGAENAVETTDVVVIDEIQYHRAPVSAAGEPYADRPDEWIELYNRGTEAVDLGGWQLADAVAFEFPDGTELAAGGFLVVAKDAAAFAAGNPDVPVVGDWSGSLGNDGDRILLLDARGNPADEVRYSDGGRWPEAADGGGSTLELRDPRSDNSVAEAWAASDETARSSWQTYTYRGTADPSAVGPDGVWNEFVMGLLDRGEVLIDDLRVVEDPDGAAVDVVQNGRFDDADHWRIIGNHRHGRVVPDPDDPSNGVLRLVATGPTEHMHNHAETTLSRPIGAGTYEISFRARALSGSNQLHTRLYFNRLAHVTLVAQPDASGTPGAPNSTRVDDAGPTFSGLAQDVAVPAAGTPVTIGVDVADPDGVAAVTLYAGDGLTGQAMRETAPGHFEASLAGQAAGTVVQFYVGATDALGATSMFPASGPESRALVAWDDGQAATNGLHTFRLLMTAADTAWLLDPPNLMSNDRLGGTVVYDESEVFYDVGVRAKGSERGRPTQPRFGYGVAFHRDQPFRGSHTSVLLDRSQGIDFGQREFLLNLAMTHAGLVSGEHNDLVKLVAPSALHTGPAELQIDRFSSLVLGAQFEDGADGKLFDYELIYYPYTTEDGTIEGRKEPEPDAVVGTAITDLGDDPEAYRWNFELQNHEREDDLAPIVRLGQTFALPDDQFLADVGGVIDVDEWLRAFAFATLAGAVDNYGGDGAQHNARFYQRPSDGLVLYFPTDLDFFGYPSMPVVGNGDLARLIADPALHRAYYRHLEDIVSRSYNAAYLGPWCDQIGAMLPGQDWAYNCAFVDARAQWVMEDASDAVDRAYPPVEFAITTNGGAGFTTDAESVELAGQGWVDVRTIELDGAPLAVTWVDASTWQVTVPVAEGANEVSLVARDLRGAEVGADTITVTR